MVAEYSLYSPQITAAFLADIAGKHDVGFGLNPAVVQDVDHREHGSESACVVANAWRIVTPITQLHGGVDTFREYGVKVGGNEEEGAVAAALAYTNRIALCV